MHYHHMRINNVDGQRIPKINNLIQFLYSILST